MKTINCHELLTYHKYRPKVVKDKMVYVCHVCKDVKEFEPHVTVMSKAQYDILKDLK